ncbi:putative NADPH-adrenodoxin reductase [Taphrina deformans PYCC 5710]|uniref:NADPH:adrenodoxin oxidoreductase, mitochondrial n=1 Tax=Taphrina deformans (strain PYCC 5710 / ATCC 11124 / CBS 356.35 / IMI 108563 / JCM 9778 / NBRC 8474) TaxID=1097556 RepID=R4XCI3_TAPDE|nr:putative NADPH-adrenodoxin reductase [Taphrina deformans PYCC 5710]|eukprot:CCG83536.1 putative NADPH-adrenodoxin reductase [Taphrina deformans PYCC 5710]
MCNRLLSNLPNCTVDIFEALPVPYGLARFGVAPDHPEVKNVTHKFDEVAASSRVRFFGNVKVGRDLSMRDLSRAYDCILFAHGASLNKSLGIPGEALPGVLSARSFVGWYNGLPEASDLQPKLEEIETAIVIGQGNVALDIARILLSNVDDLKSTDIADHALEALSRSRVKRVKIVGRRGPLEASFTIKEIRELINVPGATFTNSSQALYTDILNHSALPRAQKRLIDLLSKQSNSKVSSNKSWDIQYALSPKEFRGSSHLESVLFEKNHLKDIGGRVQAQGSGEHLQEEAQLALLSIGYQSEAITGMEDIGVIFDTNKHIVPNEGGRVTSMDGFVPGVYCSGWTKVGPVGVIASTMRDAFETADVIAQDWIDSSIARKKLDLTGDDLIQQLSKQKQIVKWDDWKRIQQHEFESGQQKQRSAEKITDLSAMLSVAAGS